MTHPAPTHTQTGRTLRDDYEVVNALGTVFMTTSERDLAVSFARDNKARFPGLYVEAVTVIELRRQVYRPRPVELVATPSRSAR